MAASNATVLGLDVGGAHLKAAGGGHAVTVPFALWREPQRLPAMLQELLAAFPPFDVVALTMTGELCDCYPSKRAGVQAIVDAVAGAAGPARVRVWRNDGRFASVVETRADPLPAAAANWLALACFAGRYAREGAALVVDVGSTTTDVVPLVNGRPVPRGRTDPERLRWGELVYTGVRRTPVCALLNGSVAAELFATTLDVCLVLGLLPEDPEDCNTADGRPATVALAHARLARMLGADLESSSVDERLDLARRCLSRQEQMLQAALKQVVSRLPAPPGTVILTGSGSFLAQRALDQHEQLASCERVGLAALLGEAISQAACAHAVAVLAAEDTSPER